MRLSQNATSIIIALPSLPAIVLQTTCQKHPKLFFRGSLGLSWNSGSGFKEAAAAAGEESEASGELQRLLDVISC